ncbi:hypothetical protein TIFTF001_042957 [Ficus carica]|uniref:Uncharacterized protein n=1 Tax=Ficus carica TaxID=3494 RepID=A0AA88CKR1_FICCA|nr:hypothetical protein TIFTF001_042957 [Ficus carica]
MSNKLRTYIRGKYNSAYRIDGKYFYCLCDVKLMHEIPPQEVEATADNNKVDLADFLAAPEDSPVIIIASYDDEEDAEEEIEDVEINLEEI